jgi:hypothetical protein
VAFRFPTLGRTFETATQAFVSGLTARDIEKGVFIDHREPTAPKFSTHENVQVKSFGQMIDMLNRDFYPNLSTFNEWANNSGYEGNLLSMDDLIKLIDHHKWQLNEPNITSEVSQYSQWVCHHYSLVFQFKCLQLLPEIQPLNWFAETGGALTSEQTSRHEYLNWLWPQYRDRLNQ